MTETLAAFFTGSGVADLILALVVLEAVGLIAFHRLTGRGLPPADLLGFLLSGVCLLLALRAALADASWVWIAFWLTAALFAHLGDLARRWPRRRAASDPDAPHDGD